MDRDNVKNDGVISLVQVVAGRYPVTGTSVDLYRASFVTVRAKFEHRVREIRAKAMAPVAMKNDGDSFAVQRGD